MGIKRHYYKTRAEWIELRSKLAGELKIGASELASACGQSKYKSSIHLFYDILGIHQTKFESLRLSIGLLDEESNRFLFEAYVPDETEFAINIKDRVRINKITAANFIAVSDEFPMIAASLDYVRPKNQPALVDSTMFQSGEIIPFSYPIDTKNMNLQYWKTCNGKLPETYKIQAYAQMIAMECKYAEMSIKVDSVEYHIIGVPYEDSYGEWLKAKSYEFYKKIEKAKPMSTLLLEARSQNNHEDEALYSAMIASLEPELTGTEAEIDFLNELYGDTSDLEKKSTDESRSYALRYNRASKLEKISKEMKLDCKSGLVHFLAGAEVVKDTEYKVTHRNKGGREYFSVKVTK